MKTRKQKIGAWGEAIAARFLVAKGYTIVQKNFSTKMGEIDIIAWHQKPHYGNTLCFIEVKTRGSETASGARATSRYEKIRAMQRAARMFCMRQHISVEETPMQFEHMGIFYRSGSHSVRVQHVVIPLDGDVFS